MAGLDRSHDNELLVALRHPLRREILRLMAGGDAVSPSQLSASLGKPLSNVSYHVRVLAECAAITLVDTKPARGSMEHFYRTSMLAPWAHEVLGLAEEASPGESSGEPAS